MKSIWVKRVNLRKVVGVLVVVALILGVTIFCVIRKEKPAEKPEKITVAKGRPPVVITEEIIEKKPVSGKIIIEGIIPLTNNLELVNVIWCPKDDEIVYTTRDDSNRREVGGARMDIWKDCHGIYIVDERSKKSLPLGTSDSTYNIATYPFWDPIGSNSSFMWSPDGQYLAYRRYNGDSDSFELYICDVKQNQCKKIADSKCLQNFCFSPRDLYLAYSINKELEDDLFLSEVYLFNIKDGANRKIWQKEFRGGVYASLVSYSGDGKKIAFEKQFEGLWVIKTYNGSSKKILSTPGYFRFCWSPDGKKLIYALISMDAPHPTKIGIIDAYGNNNQIIFETNIAENGHGDWEPPEFFWSPDSSKVAVKAKTHLNYGKTYQYYYEITSIELRNNKHNKIYSSYSEEPVNPVWNIKDKNFTYRIGKDPELKNLEHVIKRKIEELTNSKIAVPYKTFFSPDKKKVILSTKKESWLVLLKF